jgi:phosphoadenosine phosphosulfate reductase
MISSAPEEAAAAVIEDVVGRFGAGRIALATSFQKESAVLIDLVTRLAPEARIFTLDTGVLFPQTYATWRAVEERYGIVIESWRGEWVDGLWGVNPDRCCSMRKVEPLKRALAGADCWISGLRRDQSPTRAGTRKLAWDAKHGVWKLNPIADWSERDVWRYIAEHEIPYHPLHDHGYASIGCVHCTAPGDGRAGRWSGQAKTECGLHA